MATQHGALSPHTSVDLLRQAMLHRSEDDAADQLESGTGTPSGIATPRPDPSDKRLPGIMHAYFGQVGLESISSAKRTIGTAHVLPIVGKDIATGVEENPEKTSWKAALPIQSLPVRELQDRDVIQQFLTRNTRSLQSDAAPKQPLSSDYPTPPLSSSNSFVQEKDSLATLASKTYNSGGNVASRPPLGRQQSATDVIPLRTRRFSAGLKILSDVTSSSVHALHLSNPTMTHSTTAHDTLASDIPPTSASESLKASYNELSKLTENGVFSPREKNTPPHTPRALSSNGAEPIATSPATSTRAGQAALDESSTATQQNFKDASEHSDLAEAPPVKPPKGKLSVKISEARGLRPSYHPYVVCVFEWNEYISKGPKGEDLEVGNGESMSREPSSSGLPMKRIVSDIGRAMAIPMKSRQSSTTSLTDQKNFKAGRQITNPSWDHEATFDVTGADSDVEFYVYDRSNQEAFLGHVRISPNVSQDNWKSEGWFKLEPRNAQEETVTGEIHLQLHFQRTHKRHYGPEDFQILKLIGKGTFGQVYQVRKRDTQRIYAMKVLSKKVIVQKKEVAHTLGERNILVRTATADSPFIVGLKFSFQTPTDLYLVTDFMSGGELFWHLQKEGRFNEARAKFYIAELILALQHLHQYDIVYRDLKPENILLDANGHIALCDFGLSKANLTKNDTTNTFCGTTEYLAPEVLLDEQGYTTMVDFWSLGVLVFEMCCGWSPFYAEDTQQMYKNIAFGKVRFPRDALSTEGRNFVKGLLNRNPKHRLGATNDAEELMAHPFFADIDWAALKKKMVVPPFKPKLKSVLDTSNFDPEFTNALQNSSSLNARAAALATGVMPASTPLSPGMQAKFAGFTFVDESTLEENYKNSGDVERMDEDEEDNNWEHSFDSNKVGDRMSGIVRTNTTDDNIFSTQFDA